jgi:hypothetical protein
MKKTSILVFLYMISFCYSLMKDPLSFVDRCLISVIDAFGRVGCKGILGSSSLKNYPLII